MAVTHSRVESAAWQEDAACRGPQSTVFFPPATFERKELRLRRERRAKAICATCTVAAQCLAFALRNREPHGVWGGLNESERDGLAVRPADAEQSAS
jgi:WhiB family redox-sensing transcriptional regulator